MKTIAKPPLSIIIFSLVVFCIAGYLYGFTGIIVSIAFISVIYARAFHRNETKISFDDVASSELMRIRHDIADIKIQQGAKGFPKTMPEKLIRMWMVYRPYESIITFHCYGPRVEGNRGAIAIILDSSFDIEDLRRNVTAEMLIQVNTFHTHAIKKDDTLQVFYWEPEFLDECKHGRAIIKSIEDDSWDIDMKFNLSLEIIKDDRYFFLESDKNEEKKIIKINLYGKNECCHFIPDTKSERKKEADRRMEDYKKRISAQI